MLIHRALCKHSTIFKVQKRFYNCGFVFIFQLQATTIKKENRKKKCLKKVQTLPWVSHHRLHLQVEIKHETPRK